MVDCWGDWGTISYGQYVQVPVTSSGTPEPDCAQGCCLYELTVFIPDCGDIFVKIYGDTSGFVDGPYYCECSECRNSYNYIKFDYSWSNCTVKVDCY
jgi:hypothetical protein